MNTVLTEFREDELLIRLIGHIDSNNALETEEEINKARDERPASRIVIDCEQLEYISSAGLRIILRLKKQVNDTVLINVSTDVYEILSVTGFTEMMEVQKAFRMISIEGAELIGKGANGSVYRISPDTIVKVYHQLDSIKEIDESRDLSRTAFITGLPTAIPFDIVRIKEGGYGAVYEMLNATNCAKAIMNGDKTVEEIAEINVELLKMIHATTTRQGLQVPDIRQTAIDWAQFLQPYLPKDEFDKLCQLISSVPEDEHLVHGDFHLKNIMLQNGEVMLIDMDTLCHGHPIFEFAAIFNAYYGFESAEVNTTLEFLGVPGEICRRLADRIMQLYFSDRSEDEIRQIREKAAIIGYCRIMRRTIRRNGFDTPEGRNSIEKCHQFLSELLPKYDTLLY